MTITLYHVPRTISSPIVQMLLELDLVGDDFDHAAGGGGGRGVVVHELSFADLKSPSHLALNPLGTSPVLHDDELDVTIWESGAIIDYLLELYDTEHKLHPPPPPPSSPSLNSAAGDRAKIVAQQQQARAKYLQLKQFIIATVYPFVASWYIHSLKTDAAAEQDVAYLESAQHKWRTVLAPVLVDWLGDGPYFLGDQMTVASLLVAKPLTNIHALGILPEFPTLQAFFDRVSTRPSYRPAYDYGLLQQRAAAAATEQAPASATSSLPHHQTLVLVPSSSMRTATMP
jgi:glutathione S-transferase